MPGFNPWLLLVAVAACLTTLGGMYVKGWLDGDAYRTALIAQAKQEGVERHASIKKEVMRLTADDLKREYCKWVRDSEDECLRADIPVSEGQANTGDNAANRDAQ